MPNCPACNKKQNKWKVMGLTNYSSIVCPRCKRTLKANKLINSLIGGVGGGSGGFIGVLLIGYPKSVLLWVSLVAWLAILYFTQAKFTKLYVSKK